MGQELFELSEANVVKSTKRDRTMELNDHQPSTITPVNIAHSAVHHDDTSTQVQQPHQNKIKKTREMSKMM
jgi:hypothetical protein